MSDEYHPLYLQGIALFNEEDFFEAHEVWEELWTEIIGPDKKFYQGLIQAAVALLHFGNENLGGARKVYESARKYLEAYAPEHQGLNLTQFLEDFRYCFEELLQATDTYPEGVALRDERIPKIPLPETAEP